MCFYEVQRYLSSGIMLIYSTLRLNSIKWSTIPCFMTVCSEASPLSMDLFGQLKLTLVISDLQNPATYHCRLAMDVSFCSGIHVRSKALDHFKHCVALKINSRRRYYRKRFGQLTILKRSCSLLTFNFVVKLCNNNYMYIQAMPLPLYS